jgi:hypothetical protein
MIRLIRRPFAAILVLVSLALTSLSGCGGQGVYASDEVVQAARHVHGGLPELKLVTIVHYQTGRGDHTALFINGRERVVFDPAGSWKLDTIPQRGDVHYGMTTEAGASFFMSHVRETHYAVVQRLAVSPEVAEQAYALALAQGPVAPARCSASTSAILRQLPGFDGVRSTFFPQVLMRNFAELPGVQTYELHYDDPEVLLNTRRVQEPLRAPAI